MSSTASTSSSSSSNWSPSKSSGDLTSLSWSLTGPSSSRPRGGVGLPRARDLEQLLYPFGGPRSPGEPVNGPVVVDLHGRGLGAGLVGAQYLDEPAVTRGGGVGHHDAVRRLLLLAHPHESELDGHLLVRLSGVCWLCDLEGLVHVARRHPRHPWYPRDPGHARELPGPLQLPQGLHVAETWGHPALAPLPALLGAGGHAHGLHHALHLFR